MSKEEQLVKKKSKNNKKNRHILNKPPVIQAVPQRKMVPLEEILDRVYTKEDLSTVCLRQCTCCRVACPQMKYGEASSLIDHIWATWSSEDKKALLVTCVHYFFSDSLLKPCPILNGKECREYDRRSLNCRLYGMWPKDSWEDRVAMFSKSTGLPRAKLPLNVQCENVRRKPQKCTNCKDGTVPYGPSNGSQYSRVKCKSCNGTGKIQPPPLTIEQISALFESLDKVDVFLGISELKVSTSWNYRTLHDWVLMKFWGEEILIKWTNLLLTTTVEQRQGIIEAFEAQVEKLEV